MPGFDCAASGTTVVNYMNAFGCHSNSFTAVSLPTCDGMAFGWARVLVRFRAGVLDGNVRRVLCGDSGAINATRDYANNHVTRTLVSIPNTDGCFGNNIMDCAGRMGRGLLKMDRRLLRRGATFYRRMTGRVILNTVGTLGISFTVSTANMSKPANNAPSTPINAVFMKFNDGSSIHIIGLARSFNHSVGLTVTAGATLGNVLSFLGRRARSLGGRTWGTGLRPWDVGGPWGATFF